MSAVLQSLAPQIREVPARDESARVAERLNETDWTEVSASLDRFGHAVLPGVLGADACAAVAASYDDADAFRSRVVMRRHGFGLGEYQYFRYPLPGLIATLREAFYARLAPIANRWLATWRMDERYPDRHDDYLARCHRAGQTRPTPLLLRYGAGDYNCLHQDLYGEEVFPLQVAIVLSRPGVDFTGGEFVITHARSGHAATAEVVRARQGDAIVFTVREWPARGARGFHRVAMRHGVSALRSGHRHTLGVIFHDAR